MFWTKKEIPKPTKPDDENTAVGVASLGPKITTRKVAASEMSRRATKSLQQSGSSLSDSSSNTSYNNYQTSSDLVHACMNYIADNVSQVRFSIGEIDRESGLISPYGDSLLTEMFLTRPNDYQTWTEFFAQETLSLLTSGNSYSTFEKNKGKYEMWNIVPPQDMSPVIDDRTGMIKSYTLGSTVSYKRSEIMHNKLPSITSFHTGDSILAPLLDQLTLEGYATQDLIQFYQNSSVGANVLSSDMPLSPTQAEDLSTKISEDYSMASNSRHKMYVLPNNLTPKSLRLSPKDSLLLDSMDISEDRILQIFRLHKSVLGGSSENITYTHDMEALNRVVFNNAVRPHIHRLKDVMESFLRRVTGNMNLAIQVDYSNLPEINRAVLDHAETARSLQVAGVMSLNEARDLLGLPRLTEEYADRHFIAQHLVGSNFVTIEELNEEVINELRGANLDTSQKIVGADDPEGGEPNE